MSLLLRAAHGKIVDDELMWIISVLTNLLDAVV